MPTYKNDANKKKGPEVKNLLPEMSREEKTELLEEIESRLYDVFYKYVFADD